MAEEPATGATGRAAMGTAGGGWREKQSSEGFSAAERLGETKTRWASPWVRAVCQWSRGQRAGGGEGALSAGEPGGAGELRPRWPRAACHTETEGETVPGRTCDRERGLGVCALAHRGSLSQV